MTVSHAFKIAQLASLLSGGLLAGVALTVLVLELALRRLDGPQYVQVRQAEYDYFTWFIGAILVLTLIAVTILVILACRTRSRTVPPGAIALGLLLLSLAISVAVNGTINP